MTFQLSITLPPAAFRQRPGFFMLTDDDGRFYLSGYCLGKADNGEALKRGNAARIPTLPYGDTPTGDYGPTRLVLFDHRHARMGIGWIPIEGANGDALVARQKKDRADLPDEGARSGLGIHAGRGSERLVPTYGCVRLKDSDFARLAEIVGERTIEVSIGEALF